MPSDFGEQVTVKNKIKKIKIVHIVQYIQYLDFVWINYL